MDIYSKYYSAIEKQQFKQFLPSNNTELNFNKENQRIDFLVDVGDNFINSQFQFVISGNFEAKDGEHYGPNSDTKLIDNFIPYLFRSIEVKKHGKLIDRIDDPGIISTVKHTISLSQDESVSKMNGAVICNHKYGKFYYCGYLCDLGLGFFGDVKIPIYKGGFSLSFLRSSDNDAILLSKQVVGGSYAPDGKISITDFYLRVPIVEFQTPSKIELIDEMTKFGSQKFVFRSWECIEQNGITGKNYKFDVTNIYRNIDKPKFIIAAFQTSRRQNQKIDPSKFDHVDVRNIRVKVDESYYPDEMINLDIKEDNYTLLYEMYKDYKRAYGGNTNMLYNPKDFIQNRPLFVLDVRKSPINISQPKTSIILYVDFQNDPPANTNIYVLILSEKKLKYDFINNNITDE